MKALPFATWLLHADPTHADEITQLVAEITEELPIDVVRVGTTGFLGTPSR